MTTERQARLNIESPCEWRESYKSINYCKSDKVCAYKSRYQIGYITPFGQLSGRQFECKLRLDDIWK